MASFAPQLILRDADFFAKWYHNAIRHHCDAFATTANTFAS
jgi:hypothetical protein